MLALTIMLSNSRGLYCVWDLYAIVLSKVVYGG